MERQEIIEQVQKQKIIAILRGLNPDSCLETAKALQRGGIQLMEVTFDPRDMQKQQDTIKSIRCRMGQKTNENQYSASLL